MADEEVFFFITSCDRDSHIVKYAIEISEFNLYYSFSSL